MLFAGRFSTEDLRKNKRRLYIVGGAMLIVGLLSLSMPLLASFAIETLIGFLLLAVGLCNAFGAFSAMRSNDSPWQQIFMAVISFAAGIIFLTHPIAGVLTLSILLAAYFMVDGLSRIAEYVRVRSIDGSLWILLSGLLDVILAVVMWKNIFTGAAVIGAILGIDLIFCGVSMIMLGRGCSKLSKML